MDKQGPVSTKTEGRNLWCLNFEHDLALASGDPRYVAPLAAQQMNVDLSALPVWIDGGSCQVLLPRTKKQQLDARLQNLAKEPGGIARHLLTPAGLELLEQAGRQAHMAWADNLQTSEADRLLVWGWDNRMLQLANDSLHLPPTCPQLPTKEAMAVIAHWSDRRRTIEVTADLSRLGIAGEDVVPRAATRVEDLAKMVKGTPKILKAPISGSGRGLWPTLGTLDQNAERWARSVIERQGCVMVEEKWMDKTGDFALLFCCKKGKAALEGFSEFETDTAGVYRANVLKSDDLIRQDIEAQCGREKLDTAIAYWQDKLTKEVAPFYTGIIGIDMLTTSNRGRELNACVEINMRMTMGMAAHMFFEQNMEASATGTFSTLHCKKSGEMAARARRLQEEDPPEFAGGRLVGGSCIITSLRDDARYGIEVKVKRPTARIGNEEDPMLKGDKKLVNLKQ